MATTLRKCRFTASSDGTDDFVFGAAIAGFLTPAQAHAENLTYNYMAFFGNQFESGDGLYDISTLTLTRDIVLSSSSNDLLVDFASPPVVIMTYATEQPPTPGRLIKMTPFTASGTWTKDAKTKSILGIVTGGGAGGRSGGNSSVDGSGGGSGATSISLLDVSGITQLSVTVGSGGTGGPAAGGNGGVGGDSILGSNLIVAKGGSGQTGGSAAAGVGQIKADGNVGLPNPAMSGGPSWWGGGSLGAPGAFSAAGAGKNFGAGGGGTVGNEVASSGTVAGAGSPGVLWILEFT